jgi:hypothetical protein
LDQVIGLQKEDVIVLSNNAVVDVIQDLIENTVKPEKIYYNREVSVHGDGTRNGRL